MYSLNRMGFNKPLCANRQYGSSTLADNHNQNNMVLPKLEYRENDPFTFLNNFGLQPHLITDKKFADIHSVKPLACNFYPTNYSVTTGRTSTEKVEQPTKLPDMVIPLPEGTVSTTCNKSEAPLRNNTQSTNKPNKSCKMQKKTKRKRKQVKREGISTPCEKSPHKIKNANKPHRTLKFEIMETEDIPMEKSGESPTTPLDIQIETDRVTLPINITNVIEPQDCQLNLSVSPAKSPSCILPQKFESCHQFRIPSECDSEDSFIIFDNSSNSYTDILELDEFGYSSSGEEDGDEEDSLIVSSLEDVWPTKRVRFADDKDLCEVHPMVQWSFAYQKARKGPWEQIALDRMRFQRRISDLESTLDIILQPEHRNKIYNERFLTGNSSTR